MRLLVFYDWPALMIGRRRADTPLRAPALHLRDWHREIRILAGGTRAKRGRSRQ